MFANHFLVIGVDPANNEKGVPVNADLSVTFAKDMNQDTVTSSTVVLRKVNGTQVTCNISYRPEKREVLISPSADLDAGTQYQIQVIGGTNGVRGITGDYLPESKYFEFTTSFEVQISPPTSLAVSVDNGYPTVSWSQPDEYDPATTLTYELMISNSNDSTNPPIWPSTGDINVTGGNTLNVPKKLSDGNYYAYVKASNDQGESQWASTQFSVEAPSSTPSESSEEPPSLGFTFEVTETYPKNNEVDISPADIVLLFSTSLLSDSVNSDTVYIVKKSKPSQLTTISFLTDFASTKAIPATLSVLNNAITITPDAALEPDSDYTVIVRESIKNTSSESLGEAYYFSFATEYSFLYGDPSAVLEDLGSVLSSLTDRTVYRHMAEVSRHAYEIVSNLDNFSASDYENGKAPYYVHQYVRHQSAYDLLLNAHMQQSAGSGSAIRLGDLEVQKDSEITDISSLLGQIKGRIKPWLDLMHGHRNRGYAKPVSVVRGENGDPYPEFLTRSELKQLGQ